MKRITQSHGTIPTLSFLVSIAACVASLSGCGDDDKKPTDSNDDGSRLVVTAEQAGIWNLSVTLSDCEGDLIGPGSFADTLCEGDSFSELLGEYAQKCSVTENGNAIHIACAGTDEVEPGCNATVDVMVDVTFTSNTTVTASGVLHFTDDPAGCVDLPIELPSCVNFTGSGSRTGPVPAGGCD